MKQLLTFTIVMACLSAFGQTQEITGKVTDKDGEPLIGVNIIIKGTVLGTTTDADGNFSLSVEKEPPFVLTISYVGYDREEFEINTEVAELNIELEESTMLGQEVVVSASRVEENILESPVAIEKMDILDVRQAATQDFYGSLVNYKNVDMTTQSFTFRSISLRGFNANGNTRMVQLIDGVDNQAPGLNFAVGNIAGLTDLDVESVELLPGASSALYGPNAINGIVIMNSKSPFDYPGLSVALKGGVNHVDNEDTDISPFTDLSLRYAKSFNNKFAFKITAQYLDAEDWRATDTRGKDNLTAQLNGTTFENDPAHNGVSTLGDEVAFELPLGFDENGSYTGAPVLVSRTGYAEEDLVDYTARSIKFGTALHYKFNSKLEGILQANLGSGQNVYTGIDRYSIRDFSLNTYKAELRGSNFNVRAYTTRENSGDSYAAGLLSIWLNEELSPSTVWGTDYTNAYLGAIPGVEGLNHQTARAYADGQMPQPGSAEFEAAKNEIIATPISGSGGALFLDKTKSYVYEGSYNFSNQIDFAEIIVGANYRTYALESDGTLFAFDENGDEYSIDEFGGFVQASKRLFNDALKLTGSMRYDKNENFDGRTTPRISGVWSFLDGHNLRASYQTGFRMPTTQNQYIDLGTPSAVLLGGLLVDEPHIRAKYDFDNNPIYTQASFLAFAETGDATLLEEYGEDTEFNLEQNESYEIGYRGLISSNWLIDTYYYSSVFNNFSLSANFFQSSTVAGDPGGLATANVYSTTISADQKVKAQGWVFGTSYAFASGFSLSGNYAWNDISNIEELQEQGFITGFNTPEHKVNLSFENRKLTDKIGFNVAWRWQDAFLWESTFGVGEVPSYSTVDVQVSYAMPELKSRLKVGGSNIFNERYTQAIGNPTVGAVWYASITFDEFFR